MGSSSAVAADLGFSDPSEILGKTDLELHPLHLATQYYRDEKTVMRSGVPMIDYEEYVLLQNGTKRWLSTSKLPLRGDDGSVIGIVGISRDISERKKLALLREGQAQVLEMIASNLPLMDTLERLASLMEEQLNGVFGSILVLDEDGKHLRHGAAPSLPSAYSSAVDGVEIGPSVGSCGTAAYIGKQVIVADISTDPLWQDFRDLAMSHGLRACWSTPIFSHHGKVLGTFAMYAGDAREPTPEELRLTTETARIAAIAIERKRAEEQISFLAHHDALTGLPNRALLKERIDRAILETQRHNPSLAIAFIDLDNFKAINDSLGHSIGDLLLKTVAERMLHCVRSTDTVVRIGGDEFVVLLADQPGNPGHVLNCMTKIGDAISQPFTFEGHTFHVTASVGVATYPNDSSDAEALLKNADAAMYRAKEVGRDNIQFYMPEMNRRAYDRLALVEEIRNGISNNEFKLLYQPQIDLSTDQIYAVEALVRWSHPKKGLLSPADFIPLAEDSGLIVSLGDWVLHEACRQNKEWQDAGMRPIAVCVNVSARQFREPNWVRRVESALLQTRLEPKYLELELTESLLMHNMEEAIQKMTELRALGTHFAIDDFGTGYSSLSALKNFPVARLKIDQSFVKNLATDESDQGISSAIISLGKKLSLRVIAEGVENETQLSFLRDRNCDEAQGFHFSKPVAPRAIERLLQKLGK